MNSQTLTIQDLGHGSLAITFKDSSEQIESGSVEFTSPYTKEDAELLRWYFEDYLIFPFGAEDFRATKAVNRLVSLGEELFSCALDARNPRVKLLIERLETRHKDIEIQIKSDDSLFLSLPWELLRSPKIGFLSLQTRRFFRMPTTEKKAAVTKSVRRDVLVIISRPVDQGELVYDEESYHVVFALQKLFRGNVYVLRTPTFDALIAFLEEHSDIAVLHFDGHGASEDESGYLIFEDDKHFSDHVSSHDLGQLLAKFNVGFVFASACESAKAGILDPFGSVSSQLIVNGVEAVLAMPYSVNANSIAMFVEAFYGELSKGNHIADSVTSARKFMAENRNRQSAVGSIDISDWPVPVISVAKPNVELLIEKSSESNEKQSIELWSSTEIAPQYHQRLIGRGKELLALERLLMDSKGQAVAISGITGIGKTHFVIGFGEWYAATNGAPDGIYYFDCYREPDLYSILRSIIGSEYQDKEELVRVAGNYLASKKCLLILDNIEELLTTQQATKESIKICEAVNAGDSKIIFTANESMIQVLGKPPRIHLPGLHLKYSASLASSILNELKIDTENIRKSPAFRNLMEQLDGNPQSIKLILPLLRDLDVETLYDQFMSRTLRLSIDSFFELSFERLSEKAKKHLPYLSFFGKYVDLNSFEVFSKGDIEGDSAYLRVFSETPTHDEWVTIMNEAVEAGFAHVINEYFFEIHPNASGFLRKKLEELYEKSDFEQLERQLVDFYCSRADHYRMQMIAGEFVALGIMKLDEFTIHAVIRLAVKHKLWKQTQLLLQILDEYYSIIHNDFRIVPLVNFVHQGTSELSESDEEIRDLKFYLAYIRNDNKTASRVARSFRKNDIRLFGLYLSMGQKLRAERKYQESLIEFERAYELVKDLNNELTGKILHELGRISEEMRNLTEGERFLLGALALNEQLGLRRQVAGNCHHLGIIAHLQGNRSKARKQFQKAYQIVFQLGLQYEAHPALHMLGVLAHEDGDFDSAESFHRRALQVRELLRDRVNCGYSYYELGMVAREKGDLDYAESWFDKSFSVGKDVQMPFLEIHSLYELARLSLERGAVEEAENKLSSSIQLSEKTGFQFDAVPAYKLRSEIYLKAHKTEESIQDLLMAIKYAKLPDHLSVILDSHFRLGVIFGLKKDRSKALQHLAESYLLSRKFKNEFFFTNSMECLIIIVNEIGQEEFERLWLKVRPDDLSNYELFAQDVVEYVRKKVPGVDELVAKQLNDNSSSKNG